MQNKRIHWLDLAKGIGILLMMYGHFGYPFGSDWIYTFHMPLFFILSGILINIRKENQMEYKELMKKKVFSMMYPYAFYSMFFIVVATIELFVFRYNGLVSSIGDIKVYVLKTVLGYGIGTLWFLPVIFLGEMLFLFLIRKKNFLIYLGSIMVVASLIIMNGYKQIHGLPFALYACICLVLESLIGFSFIALGFYFYNFIDILEKRNSKLLYILTFLASGFISYLCFFVNQGVDLHEINIQNPIVYYVAAVSGTTVVILLCMFIKKNGVLEFIGKNSLVYMIVNIMTVPNLIMTRTFSAFNLSDNVHFCVFFIGDFLLASGICLFILKCMPWSIDFRKMKMFYSKIAK